MAASDASCCGRTLASIVFPVPGGPDSSTPLVSRSRWFAAHVASVSGLMTLCFCMCSKSNRQSAFRLDSRCAEALQPSLQLIDLR